MSTIQIISTCPLLSEFVPLAEYQASTPATFSLEETPVLYWHNTNCNASFEGNLPNLHDPKSDVQTDILVTSSYVDLKMLCYVILLFVG